MPSVGHVDASTRCDGHTFCSSHSTIAGLVVAPAISRALTSVLSSYPYLLLAICIDHYVARTRGRQAQTKSEYRIRRNPLVPSVVVHGEVGANMVHLNAEITVKVKANMKFAKIFAAAEVSHNNTAFVAPA
jgi:hypothetical protein